MADTRLVYITCADEDEAVRIARALVEARLAACGNILSPMRSVYRWEGAVEEGREAVLIAKTRTSLVEALTEKVSALHSYDCPCVVSLPIDGGHTPFLAWIADETRSDGG